MNLTLCCNRMKNAIADKKFLLSEDGLELNIKRRYDKDLFDYCPYCGEVITIVGPKDDEEDWE